MNTEHDLFVRTHNLLNATLEQGTTSWRHRLESHVWQPCMALIAMQQELHSSRMHTARLSTVSPSMNTAQGAVCLVRGVGLDRGGFCLDRGGSALIEGVCLARGVCLDGRWWFPSMHWGRTPPPPREQNHRRLWKYNLAPTSLRAVIKVRSSELNSKLRTKL